MGKRLVELKSEYYAALSKNKMKKAAKLRKELLCVEVEMNILGKAFKPKHIVT